MNNGPAPQPMHHISAQWMVIVFVETYVVSVLEIVLDVFVYLLKNTKNVFVYVQAQLIYYMLMCSKHVSSTYIND